MHLKIEEIIAIPQGITVSRENTFTLVKGPKGEAKRKLSTENFELKVEQGQVTLSCKNATKREKRRIYTFRAHLLQMIQGVQTPYVYQLKICSGHFPMNVSVSGNKFIVKNFLGEKTPRTAELKKGASVKVNGDQITVESADRELAGQTASDIEQLVRISKRDRRIFQDGIYITETPGKQQK